MACTLVATGPCTLPPNGEGCIAPKEAQSLPTIDLIFVQGTDDGFVITWDTTTPYPLDTVRLIFSDNSVSGVYEILTAARDSGIITVTGKTLGTVFSLWLRAETPTEFGDFVLATAVADANWNQDTVTVDFRGEPVTYLGRVVTFTPTP